MVTNPREALRQLMADAIDGVPSAVNITEQRYAEAGAALDVVRAWALEPGQIERAAKAAFEQTGGMAWAHAPRSVRGVKSIDMRAALMALFGGDDGK